MAKRKLTKSPADLVEEIVNLKHLLRESEHLRDIDIKVKADYWEALRQIADSKAMDPEASLVARAAILGKGLNSTDQYWARHARCVAKLSLEDFMPRMGKGAR